MTFENLNLNEDILKAIKESGFTSPTPIQEQAIPKILEGSDLLASSNTGTGKTATFILPALNLLASPPKLAGKGPRVLILVPTRELAMQVAKESIKYSKYMKRAKTVCIYGGVPYPQQNRELSRPYEILIATPGRLIDHLEREKISLARVELFILDEADRMLDMGFIKPVKHIAESLPKHQTLMFSATLKGNILKLSEDLLNNPIEVDTSEEITSRLNIEQRLHSADNLEHKHKLLNHLIEDPSLNQVIVFISTKYHADQLVDKLIEEGYEAAALHGDMNQRQRTRTILKLRQSKIKILVATDVAARGIDVHSISHVINFDLPINPEDYVHRIGRTGRAGNSGVALSFVTSKEMPLVKRIEKFTGQKMTFHVIPGLEPTTKKPEKKFFDKPKSQFREKRGSNFSFSKTKHNNSKGFKPKTKSFVPA